MAKGLLGADSSQPVNTLVDGDNLVQFATQVLGQAPVFWGRYFTSPGTSGSVEYRHAEENNILAQNDTRLLPIARQTTHVGGSQSRGSADATGNVDDFIQTFGSEFLASQGSEFLMFLDVEGVSATNPSLSLDYYVGWAQTLVQHSSALTQDETTIVPCVYGRQGDNTTWKALTAASQQNIQCGGAWVARYFHSSCAMTDWDNSIVLPSVSLPCPVLLWQYQENCAQGTIDVNQTNPNVDIDALFLSKLIVPPITT